MTRFDYYMPLIGPGALITNTSTANFVYVAIVLSAPKAKRKESMIHVLEVDCGHVLNRSYPAHVFFSQHRAYENQDTGMYMVHPNPCV
jgi:hypothetical protein